MHRFVRPPKQKQKQQHLDSTSTVGRLWLFCDQILVVVLINCIESIKLSFFVHLFKIMIYFVLASVFGLAHSLSDNVELVNFNNDKCTTIVVGGTAGINGPMNTHTSDCADCDFRINKVPARDWPAGAKRPLYLYKSNYPMMVIPDRGDTWASSNLEGSADQLAVWNTETPTTGFVPQVSHCSIKQIINI
jgi:hypothetical protein